ncbi:[3-methyl-2-oxobutanoate dehydrogenase [lipoamide]] kinase, mitochondrial [Lecanosticta acicola]|uniref:Protein-serine/threonine kinase n=1 Tax=Lecanosticta acicola TaxID=111012 RepID=A0AAI9EEY0_9PEZI|nr:[3-methyl-2-oxobutanoate dehydrogenase [lipoamide]] kinase, mitochondrial [Lecanosticta acicola]
MLSLRAVARHNGILPSAPRLFQASTRHIQTKTVTDGDILRLAARPLYPLTLADLCKHGRPPLSKQALLNSANFTLEILPSRLAHRIQSLRALPYIVVANPNVNKIHNNYVHSLSTLLPYAETKIDSLEEEIKFTEVMADLVQTHNNTIAILARGFLEARKYISKDEISRFLDEHLRARIGTRLIAEQHIALHFSSKPHMDISDNPHHAPPSYIGVIDTALKPAEVIKNCEHMVGEICELKYGVRPTITMIGSPETTIAHIPMHLEYILTELLKNSFRATIEAGQEKEPIEITIAPAPAAEEATSHIKRQSQQQNDKDSGAPIGAISNYDQGSVDYASGSNKPEQSMSANIRPLDKQTPGVTIRIRDRGGGISPENYAKLWEYGFTTFNEDEMMEKVSGGRSNVDALDAISGSAAGGSSLAGLGYGLPLARAYAEYFGGGIAVQSLWGWGTDVYLSLRGVGKIDE